MDTKKGKLWITKIKRDPGSNFVINNCYSTFVCSQHFSSNDFVTLFGCPSVRSHSKPAAVPSVFPWRRIRQRTTRTSKVACSAKQRKDVNFIMKSGIQSLDGHGEVVGMENESVDFTENDDPLNVYDIEDELKMLRQTVS